jgi:hypothetical protein
MVAGQPITTQANNEDFEKGYERIFGDAKPQRGRFVYDEHGAIPIDENWEGTDSKKMPVFTDRHMEGMRASDGTPIDNRTRRRRYMEKHGLADANDYSDERMLKAAKERQALRDGTYGGEADRELHYQVGRAHYEATKRKRR